jgi:phytoene dehydrogenase-like protein
MNRSQRRASVAPGQHYDAIVTGGGALVPQMLSRSRPKQRSPLPGLYLAGQWTTPNAGLPWVVLSGYNTARMVLADAGGHPQWTH